MLPSSFQYEVLQECRIKTSQQHDSIFRSTKKVKLPAIKITEEPTLLTKSKINRPGYESSNFC